MEPRTKTTRKVFNQGARWLKPFKDQKIKGNIWGYVVGKSKDDQEAKGHPAPFPCQLAEDHILSWSNEGNVVLDPMCGSGTTCKVAKRNRRNYIGIDISAEYCKVAEERVANEMVNLPEKASSNEPNLAPSLFVNSADTRAQ